MNFNPLIDYSKFDLNKEENLIYWRFGELIKTLITLSSDPDKQIDIIGEIGIAAEEMAIEFDNYFSGSGQPYLNHKLLTIEQYDKLKMLNTFFEDQSGDNDPDFWNDELLSSHPDWKNVRIQAKEILYLLKMEKLDLKIDRKKEYEIKNGIKHLVGESTRLKIVNKE